MRSIRPRLRFVAAAMVVAGAGGVTWAGTASAAGKTGTITVTPDTGLTNNQKVTIAGSGFSAGSIGNIVYCNNAPNEPTVALGAPVNASLPIGCIAPGYGANALVPPTGSDGTFSKTFTVATGTIGPPCGVANAVVTTCPTDSAGQNASTDAANYPCPPTPTQVSAGVTCTITYGNQIGDMSNTVSITFAGETAATTTTAASVTTAAPVTTAASATTAPHVATQPSQSLATTGPGPLLWLVSFVAAVFVLFGALLWMATPRLARRQDDSGR